MQLTDHQQSLLPTETDLAFYRQHGYWISGKILSDAELDRASAAMDRHHQGQRDHPLPNGKQVPWNWKPANGNVLRKNDYATLESDDLMALAKSPLIGAIATRLLGVEGVRLWHDQLLYKPMDNHSKSANIGWHTDRGYWMSASSDDLITAWIPFHDITREMGPMEMVDGSHLWPDNLDAGKFSFTNADLNDIEKLFNTGGNPVVRIPILLAKGQVSFHNCKTIHGSSSNHSPIARRSLAVHMQSLANRHRTLVNERQGKPYTHFNDEISRKDERGEPDYADPSAFPVLWKS